MKIRIMCVQEQDAVEMRDLDVTPLTCYLSDPNKASEKLQLLHNSKQIWRASRNLMKDKGDNRQTNRMKLFNKRSS